MSDATHWTVTHLDGATERIYGSLRVTEGVLWIEERHPYGGDLVTQQAWPLTSIRKWERVGR